MTHQDWIIVGAGWLALAAVIVGLMLDQRRIERRLRRHRLDLSQHAKRLLQIESAQRGLATSTRAPMNGKVWSGAMVPIPEPTPTAANQHNLDPPPANPSPDPQPWIEHGNVRRLFTAPRPDPTLRLHRPPSLLDIESVLAAAAPRPLTRMELATRTGLEPWQVDQRLRAMADQGQVDQVQGHDIERGWVLTDPTLRMPHQHLLPGASR